MTKQKSRFAISAQFPQQQYSACLCPKRLLTLALLFTIQAVIAAFSMAVRAEGTSAPTTEDGAKSETNPEDLQYLGVRNAMETTLNRKLTAAEKAYVVGFWSTRRSSFRA